MDKQEHVGHKGKLLFWFASFCCKSEFSLCPICFYLSIEAQFLKPRIHECAEWFANKMHACVDRTANLCCAIYEQFAYRSPQTEICWFFARTQRELDVPGVLCLPQVHGKLINCAPSANCLVRLCALSLRFIYLYIYVFLMIKNPQL